MGDVSRWVRQQLQWEEVRELRKNKKNVRVPCKPLGQYLTLVNRTYYYMAKQNDACWLVTGRSGKKRIALSDNTLRGQYAFLWTEEFKIKKSSERRKQIRRKRKQMDSEDEEHLPSEFYYPNETNDENATFRLQASCEILKGKDFFELDNEENKNSQQKIEEFINVQKVKNTITKIKRDMKVFQRYLGSISQAEKQIELLPTAELDHFLCKFFINVRKVNGDEYEPNTRSSIQRSIQRYFNENNTKLNILKVVEFEKSRKVLTAKRRNLVNPGKGSKP